CCSSRSNSLSCWNPGRGVGFFAHPPDSGLPICTEHASQTDFQLQLPNISSRGVNACAYRMFLILFENSTQGCALAFVHTVPDTRSFQLISGRRLTKRETTTDEMGKGKLIKTDGWMDGAKDKDNPGRKSAKVSTI
ncbi:hypothetical protein ATANTOWER_025746, partial [Ataeniobius toweri]|nr:hypothetical protein [Ataeniobius toweri]